MNKYKINIVYNDSGPNINEILIKTLKIQISKNLRNIVLKSDKNISLLNSNYFSCEMVK